MSEENEMLTGPEENDDLHEHHRFIAAAGQETLRVDKFLMNYIENTTRSKIQQAAKNGGIWVNNIPVKSNYKVKPNDVVRVLFKHPTYEQLLTPQNISIEIVYEDDSLLVVNKEAGMVVHPGHGNYEGTLINALIYHFDNLPNNSSNRPGLVHRIDKDTSGLLVVAKTEEAMAHLTQQFANKTSQREYVALVWGIIEEDQGTIEGNIGRHPKNRLQNTVWEDEEAEKGKPAVTHFEVIERLGYVTLVKCILETGRTHQIRAQLAHIGFPIKGDVKYGFRRGERDRSIFLHAHEMEVTHPVSGEKILVKAPLPENNLWNAIQTFIQ